MSLVGKALRKGKFLGSDGRTLIIAMDHGLEKGPLYGIGDMGTAIRNVLVGKPDAIMVAPGVLKGFYHELAGKTGLVMTIPYDPAYVREAVKFGADAVKTTYFGPVPLNENTLSSFSKVSHECDDWGMPYLAEVVPTKPDTHDIILDADVVKVGCRQVAEIGGDIVKTNYTGDVSSFREVIEGCPVPVVIMGGPKMDAQDGILEMTRNAIRAGAVGVAFGRNVWQQKDPATATRALRQIIHNVEAQ